MYKLSEYFIHQYLGDLRKILETDLLISYTVTYDKILVTARDLLGEYELELPYIPQLEIKLSETFRRRL